MVGIVIVGSSGSLPSVKLTGPRPRTPLATLRGAVKEPTPIDCSVMTRPLPRVTVSVYSIPNISMNMTIYDIFVCHTGEVRSSVGMEYSFTSADTGAGLRVRSIGANPSDRATSVDSQLVCVRQSSIGDHSFLPQIKLTIIRRAANADRCDVANTVAMPASRRSGRLALRPFRAATRA